MRLATRIVGVLAILTAMALIADRLFPPDLGRYEAAASATVLDRDGRLLRAFTASDGAWRFRTTAAEVSPAYVAMLIAIEDRRFRHHPGVDPLALARAAWQFVRHRGIVSGGSTLTMQTARLLEPRPRTLGAKLVEIARAFQLEARFSKDEILAIYLSLAPMGGNLEGVRAGSLAWFGKEPAHLSDAEAALLVALPRSPTTLRPDRAPRAATIARDRVLTRLAGAGVLSGEASAQAMAAPLPTVRRDFPVHAAQLAESLVDTADGTRTTLDLDLQTGLERVLAEAVGTLPRPINVAAVIVEHATGEVRAYAGSAGYLASGRSGMIDFARAVRSPGSTLKPFIYGMAFDRLLAHPASLIRDEPARFADYAPENFDRGFDGDVPVAMALQRSLNLPAVILLDRVGPVAFREKLVGAGIRLDIGADVPQPGLPLALGGVGTTLLDLVAAYGGLANGGEVRTPRFMPGGHPAPAVALFRPPAAGMVTAILRQAPRPLGWPQRGRDIAFKTGTSYRFRDGWAVGYDGRHTVGVWLGRADGGSCRPCSGLGGAAPVLMRVFQLLPEAPFGGATSVPLTGVPPGLARIGERALADGNAAAPLLIRFPPDGARLALERAGQKVALDAAGGVRPLRWLVDGGPLAPSGGRGAVGWSPTQPGFVTLDVIDARGVSARSRVRVVIGR